MKLLLRFRDELVIARAALDEFLADSQNPEQIGLSVLAEGRGHLRDQTAEEHAANSARHQNDLAAMIRRRDHWADAVSAEENRLLGLGGDA